MLSIALALASAITWGTGDFLGGLQTRRFAVPYVLVGTSLGGGLLIVTALLVTGQSAPPASDMWLGVACGFVSLVALGAFYSALAIGTMSIVAPISATGTAIPVIWGLAHGETLGLIAFAAVIVTVVGVILASREHKPDDALKEASGNHRTAVMLAFVAAAGFGTIFVLIAEASTVSVLWPNLALRGTSFSLICIFVLLFRGRLTNPQPAGTQWLTVIGVGFFDVTANVTYALATNHGPIAVASVVAAMYPIMTVLLAYKFLHERIAPSQKLGVALAIVGVAVLAAA
jgi:drug/metabolite transporter (DMT)-like permease